MTTIGKKLHAKPGMTMCVLDAPAGYQLRLGELAGVTKTKALKGRLDIVQVFVTRKAQLDKRLPSLVAAMGERSALWVCYPKANALGTDLNRDVLRVGLAAKGLTAVAQIAIDDVWSALRFKLAQPPAPKRRVIEAPSDLRSALRKNPAAQARWQSWAASHRAEMVDWISAAKRSQTRERRVQKAVTMLERA